MRYVWAFVVLGVLIIITALISMLGPSASSTSQSAPLGFPEYAPPPQAKDAVAAQHGFDALVSFTGAAFEPSTITIHTGKTIRFSNNASAGMQLMSPDSQLFAGAGAIAPRGYAEITVTQNGQFSYSDAQSGASGSVIVQ